ncbi:MFS transporter [Thauera aminoaromatica]|uniref:Major facilitator superfamily permease n=1 Tax=Thauera aminoaromatica TaxID=164330 RepID=C4ZLX1_THASP|nr:membrane protein [Thauera aminoaromatica]ACK54026.1 major facilitator superfamily permease [Thauera aminoaromatica]OPZ06668.1 MAG: Folate-biopterin transporter [Alphaproteobacteria bacterium ADurb.BinA305]TMW72676.1 folate/biopterin family MFS transporter [Thauera sp. UPWRP]
MLHAIYRWLDRNLLELGREMRLSYLPPLMVYCAAGVSGLTGIVGTFFVKDYLGLSAAFLAALGFWAGIPWALKMPIGHLVDLLWRYKAGLVYLGATLIAASLLVMIGLIGNPDAMRAVMPIEAWFVLSVLLSPVGYVMQDAVADAMTVEAVPRLDARGEPIPPEAVRLMHTTMQMLGRVAIIGGTVLVSLANVVMFQGSEALPEVEKVSIYLRIYELALIIPLLSVSGVLLGGFLKRREAKRLAALGRSRADIDRLLHDPEEKTTPNGWILGGSAVFVALTITVGLSGIEYGQEIIFAASFTIIGFMISRLLRELSPEAARTLLGTVIIIFAFRALPGPGAGASWWMIDELGFDQSFLSRLDLITSALTLAGLFLFRRFMAEKSIAQIVIFLTVTTTALSLPIIGMFHGLHEWTAAHTGGVVDARFIAIANTALESPLGQVSMVPMLAWIANSAPPHLKATFFAVMASFTNLALSASQLGTKYLNQLYTIAREVKDAATGAITTPADYGELGALLVTVTVIALMLPLAAILFTRLAGLRSA